MKRFLLSLLERRAPILFNSIRAIRNRRRCFRRFSRLHAEIRGLLFPVGVAISVQCGPFRGLRYFDEIVWGSITPKWLGSYEAELHPTIEHLVKRPYTTIIDVGCAEGYYAVGLAVVIPAARVIAFDTDFISRAQVRRLAELNDVADRIQIRGFCNHSDLDAFSNGYTLVVCDIEGSEAQLLNPAFASSLFRSDILVEVHEVGSSHEVEDLLQSRFVASHRIERIIATSRDSWVDHNRQNITPSIAPDTLRKAADETRSNGWVWLWMEANRD